MRTLKHIARRIFKRLEADIIDRHGLIHQWQTIDDDIRNGEIRPEWERIIIEEIDIALKPIYERTEGTCENIVTAY